MREIKTKVDREVQKELSKTTNIIAWIGMGVGLVGLVVYILSDIIFGQASASWSDSLLIFSIPFGMGLGLLILTNRNLKNVEKQNNENIYNFEDEFVNIKTIRNNEEVGNTKYYYKDAVKTKETKNYFFIYITAASAMPIKKSDLSEEELIIIRSYLKLKLKPKK